MWSCVQCWGTIVRSPLLLPQPLLVCLCGVAGHHLPKHHRTSVTLCLDLSLICHFLDRTCMTCVFELTSPNFIWTFVLQWTVFSSWQDLPTQNVDSCVFGGRQATTCLGCSVGLQGLLWRHWKKAGFTQRHFTGDFVIFYWIVLWLGVQLSLKLKEILPILLGLFGT